MNKTWGWRKTSIAKANAASCKLLITFSAPSQAPNFAFKSFISTGTVRLPLLSALFDSPNSREIHPDDFWPVYLEYTRGIPGMAQTNLSIPRVKSQIPQISRVIIFPQG